MGRVNGKLTETNSLPKCSGFFTKKKSPSVLVSLEQALPVEQTNIVNINFSLESTFACNNAVTERWISRETFKIDKYITLFQLCSCPRTSSSFLYFITESHTE